MTSAVRQERVNIALLATNQMLFLVAAITVMTLSGLVGQRLAPTPALATLPVAAMMVGVLLTALPASLLMKQRGRRFGFITGASVGAAGGAVSVTAIGIESFSLFCIGNLLIGVYQAFANYYRFAAADAASDALRSKAISLVLAGGVAAAFLGPWSASRTVDLLPAIPSAGPYAVIVALALFASALLGLLRIPGEQQARTGTQRPLREIITQPAVPVAVLAATVGYTVMILVMTATPLAMLDGGFTLADAAFVMQWHVLGMFAPSFVTGHLIARYGVDGILLAGTVILAGSAATTAAGSTLAHFWIALVLLGIGWNFLYIGGSTLLATTHTPAERGKVQGLNDLTIFAAVAVGSLLAGTLLHHIGWAVLSLSLLPFIVLTAATTLWWKYTSRKPAPLQTQGSQLG